MPGQAAALIAHQGGWDEILFVLAPIALFAGLLALANKRAAAGLAAQEHDGTDRAGDADGPSGRAGTADGAGGVDGTGRDRDGHGVGAASEDRRDHRRPTR